MSWLHRLANTLGQRQMDCNIDRELAFHIAERVDQLRAQGLTASEAQRRARIQFGSPIVQRERIREVAIAHRVDRLFRQVGYAVRALRRAPSFTATVVLTLALGIGANSAVFSALDAVLLRPLPFPDADRLMRLRQAQETESSIAPPRLEALSRVDPGFDASRMLAFRLSGNWHENYDDPAGLVNRIDATLAALAALPNVDAVATSWTLPGAPGPSQIEFAVEGRPATEPRVIAVWRTVSPGYFRTMKIAMLSGELCRSLQAGIHRPGGALDVMVNRSFADRYFSGKSPIGNRVAWDKGALAGTVSGIVDDARELGIDHPATPTVYACDSAPNPFPWLIARTNGEPASVGPAVRQRLAELEPLRSVYDMAPLDERIGDAYAQNRMRTSLLTAFAITALGLVCTGIYGTLSYAVSLRRREVALRLALGALRSSVVHQLMTTSIRIVGIGLACGLMLALLFAQMLATMLYEVSPADPATLTGSSS